MNSKSFPFKGYLVTEAKELPTPPPSVFVGREAIMDALTRRLDAGANVLVHGPEGIGKTALAAAFVAGQVRRRPGGAVWVNAGFDDVDALCDQIGQAYGETDILDAPDLETLATVTRGLLSEKRPVLVLDDVRDAQAVGAFVGEVAQGASVLALAREPLPGPWEAHAVEPLSRQAATNLFCNLSGLVPGADAGDVDRLCALLEDHPLAIEIAARLMMIEDLNPSELLALLPSAAASARAPAQGVLGAVFERLPPGEQATVLVTGVTFASGGTPGVLGAIADLSAEYMQRAVGRMETRRLGRVLSIDGHAYLTVHGAVYRFARSLLRRMGQFDAAEARVCTALAAYAGEHKNRDDALHAEWGNLLGALAWALQTGHVAEAGAIGEAVAHASLLTIRGHARLQEQLAQVGEAITPPGDEAVEAPEVSAPPPSDVMPVESDWPGKALTDTGDAHLAAGDLAAAETAFARAVQSARETGNALMEGRLLERLGRVNDGLARYERAAESYRLAAIAAHRAGDLVTESAALDGMAAAFVRLDRLDHAVNAYRRAIPLLEASDQKARLGQAYRDLGLALAEQGQYVEAAEAHREAAAAAHAAGERALERDALLCLADIHRLRQQYEVATGVYRQALDISRELGDREGEELALGGIGVASLGLRDPSGAASYLVQALNISDELGEEGHERHWIGSLAHAYQELGDGERAVSAYKRAVQLAHEADDQPAEAKYLNSLGLALSWLNQPAEAIAYYQQALTIARVIQARADQAGFLNNMGLAYMELGENETAIVHFQQALQISRDLDDGHGQLNALGNIGVGFGRMARWSAARDHHGQALAIARELENVGEQCHQLGNIGLAEEALGQRDAAIQAYKEALDIAYQVGDRSNQAALLFLLGSLLMDDVSYLAEAVSMLEESLAIREEASSPLIGETRRRLTRAQKRLERARRAGLPILPATSPEARQVTTRDGARRDAVRRAAAGAASAASGAMPATPPAPPAEPQPDAPPDLPEESIPEPPPNLPT